MKTFRYNIHDILLLESQCEILPSPFQAHDEFSRTPDMKIEIRNDSFFKQFFDSASEIMPGIFFHKNENLLISRIQFAGMKCYLAIKDFDGEGTVILSMNKSFIFLTQTIIRQPFSSLFPLEHFLKLMIGLALHKKSAVMVISAAFRFMKKNFLICAFGGMGKTTLSMDAYKMDWQGFQFLSDDTCLFFNRKVYGFPQKIRERRGGSVYFSKSTFSDPDSIFGKSLSRTFNPDFLVFLERSNDVSVEYLDTHSTSLRLFCITDKILPYRFERHIAALDYIYGFSDQYLNQTRNALAQAIAGQGVVIRGKGNDYMEQLKHLAEQGN